MNNRFVIKFGGDTTELKSAVQQANASLSSFVNQAKRIGGMVAGGLAIAQMTSSISESVKAAREAVTGEAKLLNALKGRQDIQSSLLAQADKLHSTTLFEDDEIIKQQGLLAALGRNESQIKKIIEAAVNLSAATDTDLGSAVDALNRSLSGNSRALAAIDPQFKLLTKSQLESGVAIDQVTKKYEGFAEAATATAEGPMRMFDKNISDLSENIGRKLLPALNDGLEMLNHILFGTKLNIQVNEEVIKLQKELINLRAQAALDGDIEKWAELNTLIQQGTEAIRAYAKANGMLKQTTGKISNNVAPSAPSPNKEYATSDFSMVDNLAQTTKAFENFSKVKYGIGDVTEKVKELLAQGPPMLKFGNQVSSSFKQVGQSVEVDIRGLLIQGITDFSEALGTLIGSGEGMDKFGKDLIQRFAKTLGQFGKMLIAAGIGGIALKKLAMNPYLAVAAGAALVMLSSAASAKATKMFNSDGGSGGGDSTSRSSMRYDNPGQRIVLEGSVQVTGTQMNILLTNQGRADGRTKVA